jgi:hypothetical protein
MFQILSTFMLWSKGIGGVRVLTDKEVEKYRVCSGDMHTVFAPYKDSMRKGYSPTTAVDFAAVNKCTGMPSS